MRFDGSDAAYYDCKRPAHAGIESYLVVEQWTPRHEGMLTLGDNNKCSVDQGAEAVRGSAGVPTAPRAWSGLSETPGSWGLLEEKFRGSARSN